MRRNINDSLSSLRFYLANFTIFDTVNNANLYSHALTYLLIVHVYDRCLCCCRCCRFVKSFVYAWSLPLLLSLYYVYTRASYCRYVLVSIHLITVAVAAAKNETQHFTLAKGPFPCCFSSAVLYVPFVVWTFCYRWCCCCITKLIVETNIGIHLLRYLLRSLICLLNSFTFACKFSTCNCLSVIFLFNFTKWRITVWYGFRFRSRFSNPLSIYSNKDDKTNTHYGVQQEL